MKKITGLLLVSATILGGAISLTGCSNKKDPNEIGAATREVVTQAEKMSRDELFQRAADEIKGGKLKFIGTSSRFKKAIDSFKAELTKKNAACADMSITTDTNVDGQIYTTLLGEIEAGIKDGYSAALVQDGYQLQMKGINTGYFVNYVPKEWKDANDTNKELNAAPFALQYNMKTWMVNNADGDTTTIDNVWDVTDVKYKGKLQTMDPRNENVNMDWLIMLTQDKWCNVLKEAYEDPSNDNKMDLSKYESYGELKKYAFAFMDGYLTNAVFNDDDGKARDNLTPNTAKGNLGWIVYSKIASIQESANVSAKNITIAALGKDNTDGNTATSHIKGFGGFMYKHYLQIMPNAQYPWTACAFINYLSTTEAGYKAWATDIGDYPSMPSINIDRTKFGHGTITEGKLVQNSEQENVIPAFNDPKSTWWESTTGGNVVIEDPAYIVTQYNSVMAFINKVIANKTK